MRIISANAVAASVKLRLLSIIHRPFSALIVQSGSQVCWSPSQLSQGEAAFTLDKSPVCRRANTEQQTFTLTPADNSELEVGLNFSNTNSNFVYWNNKINGLFSPPDGVKCSAAAEVRQDSKRLQYSTDKYGHAKYGSIVPPKYCSNVLLRYLAMATSSGEELSANWLSPDAR